MKKLLAVCIIGLSLGTMGVFAEHPDGWGIGIVGRGGFANGGGGGLALSLKAPSLPIFWALTLDFKGTSSWGYFGFGATGDYYLFDKALVPDINLDWYFGIGGYGWIGFYDDKIWDNDHTNFGLGVRAPLGLSWEFLERFELFVDIAPNIGFGAWNDAFGLDWGFTGELGLRFWL